MKTSQIIEGLTILEKYRDKPDGHSCDTGHDVLYAKATDRPVEQPDLDRLIEMGWFQVGVEYEDGADQKFTADFYASERDWLCFV